MNEIEKMMHGVSYIFEGKHLEPEKCSTHGIKLPCAICSEWDLAKAKAKRVEAAIPLAYQWAHQDAPELRDRVRSLDDPKDVVKGILGLKRVVLIGPAGTGKTSLACAGLRAEMDCNPKSEVASFHCHRLATARGFMPLGQGEAPSVDRAMDIELALLDDLGSEKVNQWSAIPDVIFERHAKDMRTWVTTAFEDYQIAEKYGDGIARRVFENAKVIRLGEK